MEMARKVSPPPARPHEYVGVAALQFTSGSKRRRRIEVVHSHDDANVSGYHDPFLNTSVFFAREEARSGERKRPFAVEYLAGWGVDSVVGMNERLERSHVAGLDDI